MSLSMGIVAGVDVTVWKLGFSLSVPLSLLAPVTSVGLALNITVKPFPPI